VYNYPRGALPPGSPGAMGGGNVPVGEVSRSPPSVPLPARLEDGKSVVIVGFSCRAGWLVYGQHKRLAGRCGAILRRTGRCVAEQPGVASEIHLSCLRAARAPPFRPTTYFLLKLEIRLALFSVHALSFRCPRSLFRPPPSCRRHCRGRQP